MRAAGLLIAIAFLVLALCAPNAPATQLSQTISKANHLIVLNRLGITREQIDALIPLAEQLTAAKSAWQSERQELLAQNQASLSQARATMMSGRSVSGQTQDALDALEDALKENDGKLYEAAVTVLDQVRQQLFPSQNAYIDWTPPRGQDKSSREAFLQEAQRDREYRAMVLFAEQFLTRVRYYPLEQYMLQAQKVVDDFLRPLIPIASPAYAQARQLLFRLVEEVRLLPEARWQIEGRQYATALVDQLGLYEPPGEAVQERPYTWQDMYDIFIDPGTPDTFREIKQVLVQG